MIFKKCAFQHFCLGIVWVRWIFMHLLFVCVDAAGPSVLVHDDPTSRGPTAAAADPSAADPQSPAAAGAAAAAESTHATPGRVSAVAVAPPPPRGGTRVFYQVNLFFSLFLQQQIQEVFKNQQEQLSMQLLQQKNAGIVSQEVSQAHSGSLSLS